MYNLQSSLRVIDRFCTSPSPPSPHFSIHHLRYTQLAINIMRCRSVWELQKNIWEKNAVHLSWVETPSLFESDYENINHASLWHKHRFIDFRDAAPLLAGSKIDRVNGSLLGDRHKWNKTARVRSCEVRELLSEKLNWKAQKALT